MPGKYTSAHALQGFTLLDADDAKARAAFHLAGLVAESRATAAETGSTSGSTGSTSAGRSGR